jgi:hypothetical protein
MRIAIALLFALCLSAQGQAIRNLNGTGTNLLLYGSSALTYPLIIQGGNGIRINSDVGNLMALIATNGFTGDGAGLTNLASTPGVTYVFSGKTTFTSTSYPTNAWLGPSNTLDLLTNYVNYVAAGDVAITNTGSQDPRLNTWATLTVSNSTASAITVRTLAPGVRAQGSTTTAALSIGAGKEGYVTFHSRGFLSTNYVTSAQQ